ncbi:hypothetical protein ACH492_24470 [Streptomyces sp. NPDC019443]|uniref:hypothetical protein n=1 Tax=Streptomyces sp. NPDC019443 TaxID=3365061 RepID=UPI0037A7D80B
MRARLAAAAALVLLVTGCGLTEGSGSAEERKAPDMNMQEAAERADALLNDTISSIKPPVKWAHGISTDGGCEVSRRISVTTVISPVRMGSFLGAVERHWKERGFTYRGSNKSEESPATYFLTPDGFQIRVRFGFQGQAHFEVATPCVEKSVVEPPRQVPNGPNYDGNKAPLPSEQSDFWSAGTPAPGSSPST